MARITWLGEGPDGAASNVWNGIRFNVNEPVEVTDEAMIAKARGNRFYRVQDKTLGRPPKIVIEDGLPIPPELVRTPAGEN